MFAEKKLDRKKKKEKKRTNLLNRVFEFLLLEFVHKRGFEDNIIYIFFYICMTF